MQNPIIADLMRQAKAHEEVAEMYWRRGDDYNAIHSEGQAIKVYDHIAWFKGEV